MKRILTILLVMLVLVGMIPVTAMAANVKITTQPKSVTVADGAKATVSLKATGDGLTYTWYYKNKGASSFSKTTSFTGNSYSVTMSSSRDGRQVYCVVKDKYGNSVKSDVVTISMGTPMNFTRQPYPDYQRKVGEAITLYVAVTGGEAPYTYQWQCMSDINSQWTNIEADFWWATGGETATLVFVLEEDFDSHYRYRCVVTDATGNAIRSDNIFVEQEMYIVSQTTEVIAAYDEIKTMSVSVVGGSGEYTYQWQYKCDGLYAYKDIDASWASGYTTDTLSARIGEVDFDSNYSYRCVILDSAGNCVISEPIVPKRAVYVENQTAKVYVDAGEITTMYVQPAGGSGNYSYQWYEYQEGYVDLKITSSHSEWASGYTTSVLDIHVYNSHRIGLAYYCVITDVTTGHTVTSEKIFVTQRP